MQALLGTYSSKADDLQTQLEISESQRKRLQSDLEQLKAELKSENRDLRAKVQALEQREAASQEQLKLLDEHFQRESNNHAETRERLRDSEQSVASISQLNEKLVARVWEVTDVANKTTKQNKKLLSQQRVSTVSKSTAASRASAAAVHAGREAGGSSNGGTGAMTSRRGAGVGTAASSGRQRAGGGGGMSEGVTTASRLRKKASIASSAATASGIKRAAGAKKTKSQSADAFANNNNMALLRDANLGKYVCAPLVSNTCSVLCKLTMWGLTCVLVLVVVVVLVQRDPVPARNVLEPVVLDHRQRPGSDPTVRLDVRDPRHAQRWGSDSDPDGYGESSTFSSTLGPAAAPTSANAKVNTTKRQKLQWCDSEDPRNE